MNPKFLLLLLFLYPCQPYSLSENAILDLESITFATFSQNTADWTISNQVCGSCTPTFTLPSDTCGYTGKILLGGPNILGPIGSDASGQYFQREYQDFHLSPSLKVALEFDIWSFYNSVQASPSNIGFFQVLVDGNFYPSTLSGSLTEVCNTVNYTDSQGVIVKTIYRHRVRIFTDHAFSSSLTLRITSLMSGPSTLVSFGLANFKIYMDESVMSQYPIALDNFPCYFAYYWNGAEGECDSCHSYCKTCSGATKNQCSICADGYYNFNNGTCVAACGGNFKAIDVNGVPSSCQKPCVNTGGSFYWLHNSSCSSTCDYPLYQTIDNDGIQICSNPCYGNQEYLYPDRTCKSSCEYPLGVRSPSICMGPCENSSNFYYDIGVCLSSCPSPLVIVTDGGIKYCNSPCQQQGEFIYPNDECSFGCENHLISTTVAGIEYCDSPCESYVLPNGTCTETCPFPLESSTVLGIKRCNSPCPEQYIYFNGSCSLMCSSPLVGIAESLTIKFCRNPCAGDLENSYLYPNGSCIKECESPLYNRTEPGTKYCYNPCGGNDIFLYDTGFCETTCPSPNTEQNETVAKFCHFPCENTDYYYYTNDEKCRRTCPFPYEAIDSPLPKICSSSLSQEEIEQVKQLAETTDNVNTASSSGILIGSILSSSDSTSVCMGPFSKMLQYIKYMRVDYPEKVLLMLDQQQSGSGGEGFSAKMLGDLLDEFPENELPEKFEKYRAHSSFFVNFWPALFNLLVILMVTLMVLVLNNWTKGSEMKVHKILQSILGILKWNVLLITFCGNLGDIVLFSALELQSADLKNAAAGVSFGLCLLINLLAVWMVIKILDVNSAVRKTKGGEKEIEEIWGSYKALFAAYKNQSYFQQIFLFIFIIRLVIFNGIIGYLYEHPLLQAVIINLANILILLYLLLKRPIKQLVNLIQQITLEVVLLPFNVCVLILAIMDAKGVEADDERKKIGDIMVYINVIIPILSVILMGAKLLVLGWTAYKEWKIEKANGLRMAKKILQPSGSGGQTRSKFPQKLEIRPNMVKLSRFEDNNSSSFISINPIRNRVSSNSMVTELEQSGYSHQSMMARARGMDLSQVEVASPESPSRRIARRRVHGQSKRPKVVGPVKFGN